MFQIAPLEFTEDSVRNLLSQEAREPELYESFDPANWLSHNGIVVAASETLRELLDEEDSLRSLDYTLVASGDESSAIEGVQWGLDVGGVVFGGSFRETRKLMPDVGGTDGFVEIVLLIQAIVNYDIERVNKLIREAA